MRPIRKRKLRLGRKFARKSGLHLGSSHRSRRMRYSKNGKIIREYPDGQKFEVEYIGKGRIKETQIYPPRGEHRGIFFIVIQFSREFLFCMALSVCQDVIKRPAAECPATGLEIFICSYSPIALL